MEIGTLFFVGLTFFLAYKLFDALGKDHGPIEKKPMKPLDSHLEEGEERPSVVLESTAQEVKTPSMKPLKADMKRQITAIQKIDPAFDMKTFISNAQNAYEQILTAFASHDEAVLKPLVSPDILKTFGAEFKKREKKGERLFLKVVEVQNVEVEDIKLRGKIATITLHVVSEIISVVKDPIGRILDGDPHNTVKEEDTWTFERDLSDESPVWTLVETR